MMHNVWIRAKVNVASDVRHWCRCGNIRVTRDWIGNKVLVGIADDPYTIDLRIEIEAER